MAVITISRQLGSLGTEIGREAANRLSHPASGRAGGLKNREPLKAD